MKRWRIAAGLFAGMFATACGTDSGRIEVTGDNELGIIELEAHQFDENGDRVYVLRAFDASGDEVASVRRRVGVVEASEDNPTLAITGAEVDITVHGATSQLITYGDQQTLIKPMPWPGFQAYVEVPEVVTQLGREHMIVLTTPKIKEETSYSTGLCDPWTLQQPTWDTNPTPVARQCCWHSVEWNGWQPQVQFIPDRGVNQGKLVTRQQSWGAYSGSGGNCLQSDGWSACTTGRAPSHPQGGDCYYGPNGWMQVSQQSPPSGMSWTISPWGQDPWTGDTFCSGQVGAGWPSYGDVSGLLSPSGCGGGGSKGWMFEY